MKKNIRIKTSWSQITYGEFEQLQQITSADISDDYKTMNIISILTGESLDAIKALPYVIYNELIGKIDFLATPPEPKDLKKSYIINDHLYEVKAQINDITAAQWIDYQEYIKDKPIDGVKVASVFLIPKGHNYNDGYDMDEVLKDITAAPYEDIAAIWFFFRRLQGILLRISAGSLTSKMVEMEKTMHPEMRKIDMWRRRKELMDPYLNMAYYLYSLGCAK